MSIFMSASAQEENLGDLVLRARAVELLNTSNRLLHIYTGEMPRTYIRNLGLDARCIEYSSQRRWVVRLLVSCVLSKTAPVLAFSPGQQGLELRRREFVHACVNLLLALAVRLRRGSVVKFGRSLEGPSRTMLALEKLLYSLCTYYALRDTQSASAIGPNVTTFPDVAVSRRPTHTETRNRAALSFRWDRPVPEELIGEVVAWCRSHELEPVFVTQVWKDAPVHTELARRYNCDHVDWADRDHGAQLSRVRTCYGASAIVVTNRLHAAILGWNEACVPIGYSSHSGSKIAAHFARCGLEDFVVDEASGIADFQRIVNPLPTARALGLHGENLIALERLAEQLNEIVSHA